MFSIMNCRCCLAVLFGLVLSASRSVAVAARLCAVSPVCRMPCRLVLSASPPCISQANGLASQAKYVAGSIPSLAASQSNFIKAHAY